MKLIFVEYAVHAKINIKINWVPKKRWICIQFSCMPQGLLQYIDRHAIFRDGGRYSVLWGMHVQTMLIYISPPARFEWELNESCLPSPCRVQCPWFIVCHMHNLTGLSVGLCALCTVSYLLTATTDSSVLAVSTLKGHIVWAVNESSFIATAHHIMQMNWTRAFWKPAKSICHWNCVKKWSQ